MLTGGEFYHSGQCALSGQGEGGTSQGEVCDWWRPPLPNPILCFLHVQVD